VYWVPEGLTINQVYYKQVLATLHERVRRRPEMRKNGSCVLHQDNVPAHNALSVHVFDEHKITVLEHPPYSTDLALCDFYISRHHVLFKRNQDWSIDVMKAKVMERMNKLLEDDLQHSFQQ
jgi:hypothetical protein